MVIGGLLPDSTVVDVLVILVASGIVWVGSSWLEEAAEQLSAYYGLPAVVQGSIVVAVGSSFPEFASVVVASLAGVFDMGVGAIVGSAIFNVLVIPALSSVATDEDELEAGRAIAYKEALFYMLAVSALIITFALAVIYVPDPDRGPLVGEITRPLAAIPLGLYCLYLFVQWQEVDEHEAASPPAGIAVGREWGRLLAGLAAIFVAVELLVDAIDSIGTTLGIPEFLAGVVVLAAATSMPDALVSVRVAKAGKGTTSLGNVLGSNTFDLLVAIPVGVLLIGAVPIDFAVALPMFAVLTLATVVLFTVLRTDLSLSERESYLLLCVYGLFVAWMLAEVLGVVDLVATG